MALFRTRNCNLSRSPEQRRRDDGLALGSAVVTVFLCLFVVLFN